MAPLAQLQFLYTDEPDIQALLSVDGETGSLDDNFNGSIDPPELKNLILQGRNYATDRCNFYLGMLYEAADLAQSWIVNDWATVICCRWLRCRRGNPCPQCLASMYDEAIKMMEKVQAGVIQLPGIGYRYNQMPGYSNVRVDERYWVRKLRVERPLSDRQSDPIGYNRKVDRIADLIPEW